MRRERASHAWKILPGVADNSFTDEVRAGSSDQYCGHRYHIEGSSSDGLPDLVVLLLE